MDKVLTDFANMAAAIVESLILSVPESDSPLYWLMLGSLLVLLALLLIWLLVRMRRARLAKEQAAMPAPEMTFSDVSAEAAQLADKAPEAEQVATPEPEIPVAPQAVPSAAPKAAPRAAEETAEKREEEAGAAPAAAISEKAAPSPATGEGSGFRFFKRKEKAAAAKPSGEHPEDDVFLLGLEQEMLATRQLYLDGLISKEVYVTETRALYDKAQSRMT